MKMNYHRDSTTGQREYSVLSLTRLANVCKELVEFDQTARGLHAPIAGRGGDSVKNKSRSTGKVTIVDVARAAEVSYSTVSRVANNYAYVNPETRQRVLATMEALGYVANQHARSLLTGKSQIVGVLVHALGTEYAGRDHSRRRGRTG